MHDQIERLIGKSSVVARPGCDRLSYPIEGRSTNVVYQPIKTMNPPDATPVKLLFVGNVIRRKNLDCLIQALALLRDVPVKLDVVGDCSFDAGLFRELSRLVSLLELKDTVVFHGSVSDIALIEFYGSSDIFVLPSQYEGYGIVFAEAVRAGLPIVAAKCGPVSETVRDRENGLLVPAGDPRSLAFAIKSLALDSEMRRNFGIRSREIASMLPTWEETCETILGHVRKLLNASH
jgi:glycosyltransferase involved in cell wall biosynthesis